MNIYQFCAGYRQGAASCTRNRLSCWLRVLCWPTDRRQQSEQTPLGTQGLCETCLLMLWCRWQNVGHEPVQPICRDVENQEVPTRLAHLLSTATGSHGF